MSETYGQITRWATFDCYGTLVDWDTGLLHAIESIAPTDAAHLLGQYHNFESEVEAETPFRAYREVLAEALRRAAAKANVALAPGAETILARTLPDWPIFSDVGPALSQLRANGWKLAILSNVDKDLISGTLQHMPVPFDLVITAEEVRAYKPSLNHFRQFQAVTQATPANWVHVARSYFHDIAPTASLGIQRVWINRGKTSEATDAATAVLPNLEDLPATLQRII